MATGPGATDTDSPRGPRRAATVLAWVVRMLIAHVADRGGDPEPIRRLPGIRGRDLDDPDLRLSDAAAREAWRLASAITGDEALGLHMAQAMPRGGLDLLEYAFRSSATLEQGLEQFARYGRLLNDRAVAQRVPGTDAFRMALGRVGDQPLYPQRAEFSLAMAVRLARDATGTRVCPLEVWFAHAPPANQIERQRFFQATLQFDRPLNGIAFARSDAALPLRHPDPALEAVVRRRLEKLLQQQPALEVHPVAAAVRRILLEGVARVEPSAEAVARELGMSQRTLHRRLAADGTSFRETLRAVRGELATAYLRDRTLGIAEIAFVLGYSEPAAFHRSFKRLTGQTPRSYRHGVRAT